MKVLSSLILRIETNRKLLLTLDYFLTFQASPKILLKTYNIEQDLFSKVPLKQLISEFRKLHIIITMVT